MNGLHFNELPKTVKQVQMEKIIFLDGIPREKEQLQIKDCWHQCYWREHDNDNVPTHFLFSVLITRRLMWSQRQRAFTWPDVDFTRMSLTRDKKVQAWASSQYLLSNLAQRCAMVLFPGRARVKTLRGWERCSCHGGREMTGAKLTGRRRGSLCWGRAWPDTEPHWADTALRTQIRDRHQQRGERGATILQAWYQNLRGITHWQKIDICI